MQIVAQYRKSLRRGWSSHPGRSLGVLQDRVQKPIFYDDVADQFTILPYFSISCFRQSNEYSIEQEVNSAKDFAGYIASAVQSQEHSALS